jgi:hypothetical protein
MQFSASELSEWHHCILMFIFVENHAAVHLKQRTKQLWSHCWDLPQAFTWLFITYFVSPLQRLFHFRGVFRMSPYLYLSRRSLSVRLPLYAHTHVYVCILREQSN